MSSPFSNLIHSSFKRWKFEEVKVLILYFIIPQILKLSQYIFLIPLFSAIYEIGANFIIGDSGKSMPH